MTLVLGSGRTGNRRGLAALVAGDGTVIVVRAVPMRVP
jgi:hypothetical protein